MLEIKGCAEESLVLLILVDTSGLSTSLLFYAMITKGNLCTTLYLHANIFRGEAVDI